MKRKHSLGKGISLLLALSLLIGTSVIGTFAEDSETTTQTETTALPWDGYTRITMADYVNADGTGAIQAPTDEDGQIYSASLSGTYSGTSLHHTYLDVDIKFIGNFNSSNYFHYFGSANWSNNIRFGYNRTDNVLIQDTAKRGTNFDVNMTTFGLEDGKYFNYKVLTDIVANEDGTTQTVTLQFYVNKSYAGTMTWSEALDTVHTNFYFYRSSGSFALRTPKAWDDYARITMDNYGIDAPETKDGTSYAANKTGTYTGDNLHKTYLDVDMKLTFDGTNSTKLYYLSDTSWLGLRLIPYTSGFGVYHTRNGNLQTTWISCKLPENEFFNLKLLTDIVENTEDTTRNDVQVQIYLEDAFVQTLSWTESKEVEHSTIIFEYQNSYSLRTPLTNIDYEYEISEYRSATIEDEETYYADYPTKTGYVFGGWYTDAYLSEPLDDSVTGGNAYAKFVQEDVLTVKFQKLVGASKEDETTSLRMVTSVDNLEYEYVGFKRLVADDTVAKKYTTSNAYRTVKGMVNGESYTYTPDVISEAAEYLVPIAINNIPQAVYEKDITITPLWKTLDGTLVTGTARTIQLFSEDTEGDITLYGGEEFENDNEAYYKSIWIY